MKLRSIIIFVLIIFCSTTQISKAQTSDPFGNTSSTQTDPFGNNTVNNIPPPPPDPVDTPIDGGLSILIATGVLYGIKKTRSKKKVQNIV